jgi:short-subunit dehydrogenase
MSTNQPGIALITGASAGIGREMARLLGARRHDLVLTGRDRARLEETAREIRAEHGVRVWTLVNDLAKPGAARELYDFTSRERLDIEILINNAGIGLYGENTAIDPERLAAMLQLNITALVELCHLFALGMKARGSGRILNIASTAAYQPTPFFAAYGASKAFVLNFSEALAMELADHGITVSCLSPGPTATNFFNEIDASGVQNGHFVQRDSAVEVAQLGIDMMMAGKLSKIVGTKNAFRAWSSRFASRKMVARIAKGLMRDPHAQAPSKLPA